jgi:lysylphosphatidylglycerol synthetase-like protein (DUF2156 family)
MTHMNKSQLRTLNFLSIPLLLCMGFASWMGLFDDTIYQRELPSLAAQGIGQDFVNLFVGGPILLVALLFMNRGSKTASWIFGGMVFYYLYSYIIYTFGIRHNNLFLVYCATLALSTYIFVFWVHYNSGLEIASWFSQAPPRKATAIFMLAIAGMFYVIWLKDIVPPLLRGEAPQFVIENNYATNPVHAIDLSFALPGVILTAILLLKDHKLGYLLTPVVLVFIIILTVALIGMMVMVNHRGLSDDMSLVYVFAVLSLIGGTVLVLFLRRLA